MKKAVIAVMLCMALLLSLGALVKDASAALFPLMSRPAPPVKLMLPLLSKLALLRVSVISALALIVPALVWAAPVFEIVSG